MSFQERGGIKLSSIMMMTMDKVWGLQRGVLLWVPRSPRLIHESAFLSLWKRRQSGSWEGHLRRSWKSSKDVCSCFSGLLGAGLSSRTEDSVRLLAEVYSDLSESPCSPAPLGRFSILLFWSQGKAGPPRMQVAFTLSRLGREKSARQGLWVLSSCEWTTWDQWVCFGIELSIWAFGAIPKGSPSGYMSILLTTICSTIITFLFVPKLERFNIFHAKGRIMVTLLEREAEAQRRGMTCSQSHS